MAGSNVTIGDLTGVDWAATLLLEVETSTPTSGSLTADQAAHWQLVSGTDITATQYLTASSLAAGYDYCFSIQGAIPATDGATMECQLSQGGTFLTGGADYEDGAAAASIKVVDATGNQANEGCNAEIVLPEPNVASRRKRVLSRALWADPSGNEQNATEGGRLDLNTDACDGIRLFWSAGNWQAAGKIYVYRRRLTFAA